MNDEAQGHSWGGARGYYLKIAAAAFCVTIWSGLPGTNSRSMNTIDPMNESETCKGESWFASIPIIGPGLLEILFTQAPLFPVLDGFYGQTTSKVQCVPMWAETPVDGKFEKY